MNLTATKELILQKTTLLGITQLILGLILIYTSHPDIGGGLVTTGFGLIIYQHK